MKDQLISEERQVFSPRENAVSSNQFLGVLDHQYICGSDQLMS